MNDTAGTPEDDAPGGPPHRSATRRVLSFVVTYGVVVLIFVFLLPALTGGSDDVAAALAAITAVTLVVVLALGLVNLSTNWPPMTAGLPGLRIREAAVTNTASAALANTVPEGGAVATGLVFAMQRSWGFRAEAITLGFTATGIWTNIVRYGLLAVALVLWAARERSWSLAGIGALVAVLWVVAVGVMIAILRSERFARAFGRFVGRLAAPFFRWRNRQPVDMPAMLSDFRRDMNTLVRSRWQRLTWTMIVSQLTTAFVLLAALRLQGVGAETVPASQVYVAFAASALISLIFPVPGGLGVVEASLLAILGVGQPDAVQTQILAAIFAYRAATWLLPIPIGAGSYVFWRRNTSWRRPPVSPTTDST